MCTEIQTLDQQLMKYQCPVCSYVFKDAVQISCGHWMCNGCAEGFFKNNYQPVCPLVDCREKLTKYQIFPDNAFRGEIRTFESKCLRLKFGNDHAILNHMIKCSFNIEECPHFNSLISSADANSDLPVVKRRDSAKSNHKYYQVESAIPSRKRLSSGFSRIPVLEESSATGDDNTLSHDNDSVAHPHSGYQVLQQQEPLIHTESSDQPTETGNNGRQQESLIHEGSFDPLDDQPAETDDDNGLNGKQCTESPDDCLSYQMMPLQCNFPSRRRDQLINNNHELQSLKNNLTFINHQDQQKALDDSLAEIRLLLSRLKLLYSELLKYKSPLCNVADKGNGYTWKINVSEFDRNPVATSPFFYSHLFGYKMSLHLFVQKDGMDVPRVAIDIVIPPGEFDETLSFPFPHSIIVTLINRDHHKDVVVKYHSSPLSDFHRYNDTTMRCSHIIPLDKLNNESFNIDRHFIIKVKVNRSFLY